jgi:hypothetical protein
MTAIIGKPKHSKCDTCKNKITDRYVMFDRIKYCLKCFYMSGKSLPIFHEIKRKY